MVHFTQYDFCILFYSDIQIMVSLPLDYSIRKSGGKWIFAPDPGLSQLITSFFALQLPGIRHRPVFAWPYHLFRSFTKTGTFVCTTFSNQAVIRFLAQKLLLFSTYGWRYSRMFPSFLRNFKKLRTSRLSHPSVPFVCSLTYQRKK